MASLPPSLPPSDGVFDGCGLAETAAEVEGHTDGYQAHDGLSDTGGTTCTLCTHAH